MTSHEHDINWLMGEFFALMEQFENDPESFQWENLRSLAEHGAQAYNEGSGPSFHALAIDGIPHTEFHYRFLSYSVAGGFDPFKMTFPGAVRTRVPVIDHEDLASASLVNPWSGKMRELLFDIARERFSALSARFRNGTLDANDRAQLKAIDDFAESIPADLLAQIKPSLKPTQARFFTRSRVNALEGHLSRAELAAENPNVPPAG